MIKHNILYERSINGDMSSKFYNRSHHIEGDEEIVKNGMSELADILLRRTNSCQIQNQLNELKTYYLSLEKCKTFKSIINNNQFIIVVPSKANYHKKSGLYRPVWERRLNLINNEAIGILNDSQIDYLRLTRRTNVEVITLSDTITRSLERVITKLERKRAKYLSSKSSSLLYKQPKRRCCSHCTIL